MGAQQPRFNKHLKQFKGQGLQYATSSMQGWRPTMQDAHLAISPFYITKSNQIISLFGVFDGHGGHQVANFVQKQFPKQLLENQYFLNGNYQLSLKESLMKMDQLLKTKYEVKLSEIVIEQYKQNFIIEENNQQRFLKKSKNSRTEKYLLTKKKINTKKIKMDPQKQQETESSSHQYKKISKATQQYKFSSLEISRKYTNNENLTGDYNFILNDNCGCTAIICLITNDYIYTANIGDSRAVACIKQVSISQAKLNSSNIKTQGNIPFDYYEKELSKDHKPDNQKQKLRIQKAGGKVQNGRINGQLNLSRAIGDIKYKNNSLLLPEQQIISCQPDIIKIPNQNVDYIIMGCDGIWQIKSSQDMVQWINSKLDAKELQNFILKNKKTTKDKKKKNQFQIQPIGLGSILSDLFDQLVAKDKKQQTGKDNMSAILIKLQDRRLKWFKNKKKLIDEELF